MDRYNGQDVSLKYYLFKWEAWVSWFFWESSHNKYRLHKPYNCKLQIKLTKYKCFKAAGWLEGFKLHQHIKF